MNQLYKDLLTEYAAAAQRVEDTPMGVDPIDRVQAQQEVGNRVLAFLLFFGLERVLNTPETTLEQVRRVINNSDDLDAEERENLLAWLQDVAHFARHDTVVRAIGRP
jgi:hypothetical protein